MDINICVLWQKKDKYTFGDFKLQRHLLDKEVSQKLLNNQVILSYPPNLILKILSKSLVLQIILHSLTQKETYSWWENLQSKVKEEKLVILQLMLFNLTFMMFKKSNLDRTSQWLLIKKEKFLFGETIHSGNSVQEVFEMRINQFYWIIL